LIFLTKADLLSLLQVRYVTVLVPTIVVQEIQQYGPLDTTAQAIQRTDWLTSVEAPPTASALQACNLNYGRPDL